MSSATPTRRKLGNKIRKVRKQQNISQEELGFRAGIHRTYVGSIERGEQNVSIDNIHKLARALKVSVSELLG
ncbi:transcriptional regulator [Candidatus Collierbacteria bacterium RIFOXYD1_FULL_40_9]|uniref:Transcriptional regulator n=1 Tax=Candidatus Collierbacteria bacterium RIFOXYD1_FULL_40_9 TaxID=1817731 RepID=A0A1F5FPK9_9BACT|nr:MAG: transcriptional regulator [Candidatus Collierbacteria bacterium RIFOXYD1_FULL_40_9]